MRSITALLLLLCLLAPGARAEEPAYTYKTVQTTVTYDAETLRISIETCEISGTKCYLTRVWMAEPARQIRKASSPFHEKLAKAETLAQKIPGAALVINGSGYVSPLYPDIPENYPGTSEDYYYTPLGSVTVTDGTVLRKLDGVPYYGLTLEEDGLHMHVGEDPEAVLARNPSQTWSFYEGCPLILGGEDLLDREWPFARRKAIRTIICRMSAQEYLILTVTNVHGLGLTTCVDFLLGEIRPEWAYNLDGGPSSALFRRKQGKRTLKLIFGAKQKIVDVMGFVE